MKIELENFDVPLVMQFLDNINFVGIDSVYRTQLTRHLAVKTEEIMEGEKTIRKDHEGDPSKLNEELKEYAKAKVVIEGGDFFLPLQTVKKKVKELISEDSTHEFKGQDSVAVAALYEAFNLGGE